jgi:hypothetical protein
LVGKPRHAPGTPVSIPGIVVTNGTCQIGVQTTASANQWLDVDDFTLIKN